MRTSVNRGRLTDQQTDFLLSRISRNRVQMLRGMAHLEAWDVRRTLIRVFGFGGFSLETLALDLVAEREAQQGKQSRWTVVYRAQVRLTVYDGDGATIGFWDDAAAGDAVNQKSLGDAHDQAMKTAVSQALKRCAVNLGDQFGLSLYNAGSADPVVIRSLAYMDDPVSQEEDVPVQPEPTPEEPRSVDRPRDFVAEARATSDPQTVRRIWREAKAAGANKTSLGHIEAVGKSLAALSPPGAGQSESEAESHRRLSDGELYAAMGSGHPEVEKSAVASVDDAEAAEKALRALGDAIGLPDIGADFERAKGLPLSTATAEQIRAFHAELNGTAA